MHSRLFWPARACPAWAVNGPAGPDYEPVSSHSADVSLVSVFRSWTAKTGQWRWTTEESGEHVTVHSRKIKTRRRSTRKEQLTSHRLKERRTRPSSWYHRPSNQARPADRPSNLPDPPTGPNCETVSWHVWQTRFDFPCVELDCEKATMANIPKDQRGGALSCYGFALGHDRGRKDFRFCFCFIQWYLGSWERRPVLLESESFDNRFESIWQYCESTYGRLFAFL